MSGTSSMRSSTKPGTSAGYTSVYSGRCAPNTSTSWVTRSSIELCTASTARVVSSSDAGNSSSLSVPLPSSERPIPNCDEQ